MHNGKVPGSHINFEDIDLNVKFPALSDSGVKNKGSHLKNNLDLELTLKVDLKVKDFKV